MADDWFMEGAKEAEKTEAARRARVKAGREQANRDLGVRQGQERDALRRRVEMERARMAAASRKSPGEVAAAKNAFSAVGPTGVVVDSTPSLPTYSPPPSNPYYDQQAAGRVSRNYTPTPDGALDIILEHVRRADDPYAEAGRWMTTVTQALTGIAQAALEAEERE